MVAFTPSILACAPPDQLCDHELPSVKSLARSLTKVVFFELLSFGVLVVAPLSDFSVV